MCILLQLAAMYVPFLQRVLHTTALNLSDWIVILGLSLLPVLLVELVKLVQRLMRRPATATA